MQPASRFLGVHDLFMKFEGTKRDRKGKDIGWALALMEMLTDTVLYNWVPAWLSEQYERANPFFKEVLLAMQSEEFKSNEALFRKTKREMIRRHQLHLRRSEDKKKKAEKDSESDDDAGNGESNDDEGVDAHKEGHDLASKFLNGGEEDEDPNAERVQLIRERLPGDVKSRDAPGEESSWDNRTAEERLSASTGALKSADRVVGSGGSLDAGDNRDNKFGVMFNPKNFDWTNQECNVDWSQKARIDGLADKWFGKAFVGDGADVVDREDLDPWQKFAHDVVMDSRH